MPNGRKISQFPAAAGINNADVVGGVQNGVSTKFSFATILLWLKSVLSPSDIGAQAKITASGILKGNGTGGVSAATPGTDYATPSQIPTVPSASDSTPQDLGTATPGTSNDYSRADHVHTKPTPADIGAYVKPSGGIPASDLASGVIPTVPSAYTSNPEMDGTASPGSSGEWAKGDHVHPSDTTRAPAGYGLGVQLNTLMFVGDANDITVTGWFCTNSGTLNLPADRDAAYAGAIESVVRGTTYMYQRYYDYHAAKIFDRTKNEGGWGAWRLVSPTATEQQIAYVETGTTASRAYAVGEHFCWNGLLYRVKTAISSGGTFTPGTNCETTTVGEEIQKKALFSTTSSSPVVLSFGPNTRAIIFATSTNAGGRGIYSTSTNSSSTAAVSALVSGNAITMTSSGSSITVSSSTNVVFEILMLAGNLPTIS